MLVTAEVWGPTFKAKNEIFAGIIIWFHQSAEAQFLFFLSATILTNVGKSQFDLQKLPLSIKIRVSEKNGLKVRQALGTRNSKFFWKHWKWSLGHAEKLLFSCLCSKLTVYSWKLQWFFLTSSSCSACELRVHRAGSQLNMSESQTGAGNLKNLKFKFLTFLITLKFKIL